MCIRDRRTADVGDDIYHQSGMEHALRKHALEASRTKYSCMYAQLHKLRSSSENRVRFHSPVQVRSKLVAGATVLTHEV